MSVDLKACWQLPITSKPTEAEWISPKSKYHFFTNDVSMCGKYYQVTKNYENFIESEEQEKHIENMDWFCKKCQLAMQKQEIKAKY